MINKKNMALLILCVIFNSYFIFTKDKFVSITMDDMPFGVLDKNFSINEIEKITDTLLDKFKKFKTPVAAFINGKGCLSSSSSELRIRILKRWINNPLVSLGNHTSNHLRASKIDHETFKFEVMVNDYLIRSFSNNKPLQYFRFPYNDLGKNNYEQNKYYDFLAGKGYKIAPFTIESVDYLFNTLYVNALKKGDSKKAKEIASEYINFTIKSFDFFEKLSEELFGRNIGHIFLCHANKLNSDHYDKLIKALIKKGYKFITLESVLKDPVYSKNNYYFKKWGISWIYRWIKDKKKRSQYIRKGIDPDKKFLIEYENLNKQ